MFAQDVYGIPLTELEKAQTASSVAEELLARVAGRPVYSDAPSYDLRWARRLLDAHPSEPGIRILDYDQAVRAVCGEHGANWAYERLERSRTPHRAGPDAVRMTAAILYGLERSGEPPASDQVSP